MIKIEHSILATIAWFAFIAHIASAQEPNPAHTILGIQLTRKTQIKGLQIPFYGTDSRLEARVRMQSVAIAARNFGFFQLGLLPQMMVKKLGIEVYEIGPEATWPLNLCNLFLTEKPLADAEIVDVEIITIPQDPIAGQPPAFLRIGLEADREIEEPGQYYERLLHEALRDYAVIRETTAPGRYRSGVHVTAAKCNFCLLSRSLLLSHATIKDREGLLHTPNTASLILAGDARGCLNWTEQGKKESIDLQLPSEGQ